MNREHLFKNTNKLLLITRQLIDKIINRREQLIISSQQGNWSLFEERQRCDFSLVILKRQKRFESNELIWDSLQGVFIG